MKHSVLDIPTKSNKWLITRWCSCILTIWKRKCDHFPDCKSTPMFQKCTCACSQHGNPHENKNTQVQKTCHQRNNQKVMLWHHHPPKLEPLIGCENTSCKRTCQNLYTWNLALNVVSKIETTKPPGCPKSSLSTAPSVPLSLWATVSTGASSSSFGVNLWKSNPFVGAFFDFKILLSLQ